MSFALQIIIENLVDTVFEGVNHVEEAVVALYSLNNYSKRKNLKRVFKRKTSEVEYLLVLLLYQDLIVYMDRFVQIL